MPDGANRTDDEASFYSENGRKSSFLPGRVPGRNGPDPPPGIAWKSKF